jgi:hypothetical protein
VYPHRLLNKKHLALHWGKGTAEFLPPEFGTVLVNAVDADYTSDIQDCRSVMLYIHLLNGFVVAWKCKKKFITTLHSTGSEITSLVSGVKKTNHIHDFSSSLGYPFVSGTPTLDDSQVTIRVIKASHIPHPR